MDLDSIFRIVPPLLFLLWIFLRRRQAKGSRRGERERPTRDRPHGRDEGKFRRDYDPIEPK